MAPRINRNLPASDIQGLGDAPGEEILTTAVEKSGKKRTKKPSTIPVLSFPTTKRVEKSKTRRQESRRLWAEKQKKESLEDKQEKEQLKRENAKKDSIIRELIGRVERLGLLGIEEKLELTVEAFKHQNIGFISSHPEQYLAESCSALHINATLKGKEIGALVPKTIAPPTPPDSEDEASIYCPEMFIRQQIPSEKFRDDDSLAEDSITLDIPEDGFEFVDLDGLASDPHIPGIAKPIVNMDDDLIRLTAGGLDLPDAFHEYQNGSIALGNTSHIADIGFGGVPHDFNYVEQNVLRRHPIPIMTIEQQAGEMVAMSPGGFHQSFDCDGSPHQSSSYAEAWSFYHIAYESEDSLGSC